MGSSYGVLMLACVPGLIMFLMLNPVARVDAAIPSCTHAVETDISRKLTRCIPFLSGNQKAPTEPCCTGVKSLNAEYTTTTDRQKACSCLKASFARHPAFKLSSAQKLPIHCHVNIRFSITANVDCSRVR